MDAMQVDKNIHVRHQEALYTLLKEFDRVCKHLDIPYVLFAGTLLGSVRHEGFIPWDDDLDVMMLRTDYERFLREADAFLDRETFFLQREFSEHWPLVFSKLRLNNTTCLEKFHPRDVQMHQGIYMDIFPCDNAAGTEIGRRIQFLASKVVIAKALDKRGYDTDSKAKKLFMAACRLLPTKPFWMLAKAGKKDSAIVHSFFGAASAYRKNLYPRHYFQSAIEGSFEGGKYPIPEAYDELLQSLYGDYMKLPPPEDRVCKQHAILVDFDHSYEMYQSYRDDMKFDVFTRSIR